MANIFSRIANGAVQASPFVLQAVRQNEAKQQQDMAVALARLHQQSLDNTATINAQTAAAVGLANIRRLNAEADALEHPPTTKSVMRGPGGQLVDLSDPENVKTIGPAPIPRAPTAEPLVPVMRDGKRVYVKRSEAAGLEAPAPAAPQNSFTAFQGTDPTTGQPVVRPFNTKTGTFGDVADVAPKPGATGVNSAPMAAKVGQAGEMIKKAADILPLMEGLGVSLGQSASADIAQNGIGIGHTRIPGTRGVGNLMVNQTPQYAQYQATLSPFVLAAAHALSGARINDEQVKQIRASIEVAPGDLGNPQVVQQKTKNLLDLVNSIAGSLPPDAMSLQESQIDPTSLSALVKRGYKKSAGRGTPPPNVPHPPSQNDHAGPPSIGGAADPEAAWAATHPPHPGESFDAYHARYLKGGDE